MHASTTEQVETGELNRSWQFFWLMLFAAAAPMLISHLANLWNREAYRYFPFVLLAVGWMLYTRWDQQFRPPTGWIGWAAIFSGLGMIFLAVLVPSPWLATLGFLCFSFAFFTSSREPDGLSMVTAGLPLIMLVNLPLGLDQLMVIRLQQITTSMSSVALDLLAVPHAIENNVIRLASRDLFVAEACSGIQSVFTLMFMATLVIAMNRRLLWLTPIYLVIAMLLAIFANVLRVTTVAVGDVWMGVDLADGWQHDVVGYAALGLGCLFLLSFDQLLVALLHPIQEGPGLSAELNPLIHAWNFCVGANADDDQNVAPFVWLFTNASARGSWLWRRVLPGRALIVVSSVLLLASIGQAIHTFRPIRALSQSTELIFSPRDTVLDSFPQVTVYQHEVIRDGNDPRLGDHADVWTCRLNDPEALAQLVVSQPYADWHELCWCYTAQNWTLLSRIVRDPVISQPADEVIDDSDRSDACPFVLARFRFGDDRFAYLFYSAVDRSGTPIDPPLRIGRLQGRFGRYLEGQHVASSDLAMIQLLVVSDRRFNVNEVDRLSSLFSRVRQSVLRDGGGTRMDGAAISPDGAAQAVIQDSASRVSP